jgi:hypothetical protein
MEHPEEHCYNDSFILGKVANAGVNDGERGAFRRLPELMMTAAHAVSWSPPKKKINEASGVLIFAMLVL